MARRSDHSRAELADLVIAAARGIAAADGARAVTMRRIATAVGYVPGSIYNAVGDLDDVLQRVNADTLVRLGAALEQAVSDSPSGASGAAGAIATVLRFAGAYMRFVAAEPHLWAAVIDHPPKPDRVVPEWYAQPRARLIEIGEAAIGPLFPDLAARRRAVITLWAALQGVAALTAGGNLRFVLPDGDAADIARALVLRYLTGSEDPPGAAPGATLPDGGRS